MSNSVCVRLSAYRVPYLPTIPTFFVRLAIDSVWTRYSVERTVMWDLFDLKEIQRNN